MIYSNYFMLTDPYDIKPALGQTTPDDLEADAVYAAAVALAQAVQDLHRTISDTPRWGHLYDQCQRAAQSTVLNYSQGFSRLRGYTLSDWLIARGELMEVYAGLTLGPQAFRDLKPAAKQLLADLDARLLALPEKCDRPSWRT